MTTISSQDGVPPSDSKDPPCWVESWRRHPSSVPNLLADEVQSDASRRHGNVHQVTNRFTAPIAAGVTGLPVHGSLDRLLPAGEPELAL